MGAGQLPCKGSQDLRIGADTASFFYFPGRTPNLLTPTVMRRHREDIFHTTCTACKDLDRRDPSIPLRSTRDDSFRCHPEWSTFRCEVETSRPIGACTLPNHTRCTQPAKDETFECSPSPGVAADCRRKAPNRTAVTLSGAMAESKGLDIAKHSPVQFKTVPADPAVGIPRQARDDM